MKNITAKVTHTPILYNGKHYAIGSTLTLPESEYLELKYYLSEPLSTDDVAKTEAKQITDELDQVDAESKPDEADAKPDETEAKPKKGKK